jgi:hypothetical protein
VAKKDRVPTPPKRPVQAPKAYKPESNPRRTQFIFVGLAVVIVIAAAAVGIGFVMAGGDEATTGPLGNGDCTVETFAPLGRGHVDKLPADYEYNSVPATSGVHSPQTAIWNIYDQPVPQIHYVHNLEHGGVVAQYGSDVPPATVDQIRGWYQEDPRGLIVAPLVPELEEEDPTLANKIVVVSWTHMMRCSTFDEEAFTTFSEDYRGDAPEAEFFPLDSLQPGSS